MINPATYPAHLQVPGWDAQLRIYIDSGDAQSAVQYAPGVAYATGQPLIAPDGTLVTWVTAGTSGVSFAADLAANNVAIVSATPGSTQKASLDAAYLGLGASALPAYVINRQRPNPRDPAAAAYNRRAATTKRTRAGLGRAAAGGHSVHVVLGTSFSAACTQGLAPPYAFDKLNAWPLAMRNELARHGVPIAGTGWVMTNDGAIGTDPRLTFTGASWSTAGINYRSCNAGDSMTYVPDMGGTHLSFWIYDNGSAGTYPFTVSQNGTTVWTTSANAGPSAGLHLRTMPLQHSAGDTIVVTAGANGMLIGGIRTWAPGIGGIEVHNLGQSSSMASGTGARSWSDYASTNALGLDWIDAAGRQRVITDGTLTSGSPNFGSATANFTDADLGRAVYLPAGSGVATLVNNTAYIKTITSSTSVVLSVNAANTVSSQTVQIGQDPDAVHIELGYNDLKTVSRATTIAAITTIAAKFPLSDIYLHVFAQPDTSVIAAATFDGFASDLYDLADTLVCNFIDNRERQGIHTDIETVHLSGDNIAHQNSAAYIAVGRNIAQTLVA